MCVYIKTYESSRNQPKDFTILKLQLDLPVIWNSISKNHGPQFQHLSNWIEPDQRLNI